MSHGKLIQAAYCQDKPHDQAQAAVNVAAVTIFVTFAAAALVCVVLGALRRVVLGLRVDRAATRQLLGAAHSRTMA